MGLWFPLTQWCTILNTSECYFIHVALGGLSLLPHTLSSTTDTHHSLLPPGPAVAPSIRCPPAVASVDYVSEVSGKALNYTQLVNSLSKKRRWEREREGLREERKKRGRVVQQKWKEGGLKKPSQVAV